MNNLKSAVVLAYGSAIAGFCIGIATACGLMLHIKLNKEKNNQKNEEEA